MDNSPNAKDFNQYYELWKEDKFERVQEHFRHEWVKRFLGNKVRNSNSKRIKLLEVGPGNNPVFPHLSNIDSVTVVEPIKECVHISNNYANKNIIYRMVEDVIESFLLKNTESYDGIILVGVLHEIGSKNTLDLIYKLKTFLNQGGFLFILIPNSDSLHLQEYKLKNKLTASDITPRAKKYNNTLILSEQLLDAYKKNKFNQIEYSGLTLKPYSHDLMLEFWRKDKKSIEDFISKTQELDITKRYGSEFAIYGVL